MQGGKSTLEKIIRIKFTVIGLTFCCSFTIKHSFKIILLFISFLVNVKTAVNKNKKKQTTFS